MQRAFLTITTTVDGEESRISRVAEMELSSCSARLRYEEQGAFIAIEVADGAVSYVCEGDYGLSLRLLEGKQTEGQLSLGATQGVLLVTTKKVQYNISKSGLLLKMEYTLLFGEEKQEMRLNISARYHLEEK